MTAKIKGNKGFTLVEIIVALAILALLSGTLLQVFVLSSDMNSRADDMDRANVLATSIAEDFKSGANAIAFFNGQNISAFKTEEFSNTGGSLQYTQNYNNNWGRIPKTDITTQRAFSLTAKVEQISTASAGNTVFSPSIDMSASINTSNPENSIVLGPSQAGNRGSDGRLGVRINYPGSGQYNISLTNNTGVPVDLYVFGTDSNSVKLTPLAGESTIRYIPNDLQNTDTNLAEYRLTITIVRIIDGVQLCSYSVSKYIAQ